jgi:hypothetical protein
VTRAFRLGLLLTGLLLPAAAHRAQPLRLPATESVLLTLLGFTRTAPNAAISLTTGRSGADMFAAELGRPALRRARSHERHLRHRR